MKNSKLISLLKSFSKAELREFGQLVRSPFFTNEKVHSRLLNILKKYHPLFTESKIEKQKIYKLLYPARKYNDGAMRNIVSDFLKLEMDYLRIRGLKKDEFYYDQFLLDELMERNEEVLFQKTKRKIDKSLSSSYKNSGYYYKKLLLEGKAENMNIKTHDRFIQQKEYEKILPEHLLGYTILEMLYINSKILISNRTASGYKYETVFDDGLTGFIEGKGSGYLKQPYIKCYYLMYKMLKTGDEKYFSELKQALFNFHSEIENTALRNLFTAIENYAVEKINAGLLEFCKEQFLIYRFMVEQKLYSGSFGHMRHIFYLNTVSIGLEAGEMNWVDSFIKDHKNAVYEEFRENSYNLAYAILCYWKKDYNSAVTHVSRVTTDDFAFKINIRSLYLKIYYDLNETESFYSHIDALKHYYTKSKDVPKNIRPLLADYVNFSKKLFVIKNGTGTEEYDLVKLKKEITESRFLMNKTWLLKKTAELEKK